MDYQIEVTAFESALPLLLAQHDGAYVVIFGGDVLKETFPSYEEALKWGYERFGLARFFVKQVTDQSHAMHYMRGGFAT